MCAFMVQAGWGFTHLVAKRTGKRPPHRRAAKHKAIQVSKLATWAPDHILLLNIKDPYAWLVSWHAWTVQAKAQGTRIPETKIAVTSPPEAVAGALAMYNDFYGGWLASEYEKVIVRYEDLLEDINVLYDPLAKLLGEPEERWDALPHTIVRPDSTKPGMPKIQFKRDYYTEKQYLELLSPEQIAQVTELIDWPTFEGLYVPEG
jgi:hypothetical protein